MTVNIHNTHTSLRKQVFELLEKTHDLSPSQICDVLHYPHKKYARTISQYKKQWRCEYQNRHDLKRLSFHKVRGWIEGLKSFSRGEPGSRERVFLVQAGWEETQAKNRMMIFRSVLGRLEWFETGRINIWIKKPANWGKVKQLLALGFHRTGLVRDVEKFDLWAETARFWGAHVGLDLGVPLPYGKIDLLKESLGVVAKTGDASHPTWLELEFVYPDWARRNELLLELNKRALEQNSQVLGDLLGSVRSPVNGEVKRDVSADRSMIS